MTIYEVRNVEHDDPDWWKKVEAIDEEHAAELWAHWEDSHSAEYSIVCGRVEPVVEVRDPKGNLTRWTVSGESVPSYHARHAAIDRSTAK